MPPAEPIRVGVFGAGGRMGRTVCEAIDAAADLVLAAAVDPHAAGQLVTRRGTEPIVITSEPEALERASATVAVDFTVAEAAVANLTACANAGIHGVCGTTGLSEADLAVLAEAFGAPEGPNGLIAANFSISAVVMMRLAALAAPLFEGIEIIELHHEHKSDAPSGTALATARAIEAARRDRGAPELAEDPTQTIALADARGARSEGGVQIHSVRLPGLVAHQEVLFGTTGQTLSIRQDSTDRSSFMPGVLLAVRRIDSTPGLTIGLEGLLDL